jgi:hypothetical protein
VNISAYSPLFILDVFSCIACTVEGFCDLLFVVLQFQRPNGSGTTTGTVALCITCLSTLFHLSPAGAGFLTATVLRDTMPYKQAKEWVQTHARTEDGEPLRSKADWNRWLSTASGKHRPSEITSVPDIEYKKGVRLGSKLRRLKTFRGRRTIGAAATAGEAEEEEVEEEEQWVSWEKFLGVEPEPASSEAASAQADGTDGDGEHAGDGEGGLRKTAFWSHLYVKTIILPRQARDKHRENSKKACRWRRRRSVWACADRDKAEVCQHHARSLEVHQRSREGQW